MQLISRKLYQNLVRITQNSQTCHKSQFNFHINNVSYNIGTRIYWLLFLPCGSNLIETDKVTTNPNEKGNKKKRVSE